MGWQQTSQGGPAAAFASAVPQQDAAQKVKEANIEFVTNAYERGRAYTNMLILAGYAGGFAVWNFSRPVLSNNATVCIALSFLISLAAFVLFEVYQMVTMSQIWLMHRAVLLSSSTPEEFFRRHTAYKKAVNEKSVKTLLRVWVCTLYVTLASALVALALLLYNFVSTLTGLPAWP